MRAPAVVALATLTFVAVACRELNPDFVASDNGGTGTGVESSTTATEPSMTGTSTSSSTTTDDPSLTTAEPTSTGSSSSSDAMTTSTSEASGSSTAAESTTSGCPRGETDCFGQCKDLMTDNDNCGECGMDCHPTQETCIRGTCTPR